MSHKMRGIVSQSEVGIRYRLKHPPLNRWASCKVLSSRPFIASKQHRAILNRDPDTMVFPKLDQIRPKLQKARPIVFDGTGPVTSNKRTHNRNPQRLCSDNNLL